MQDSPPGGLDCRRMYQRYNSNEDCLVVEPAPARQVFGGIVMSKFAYLALAAMVVTAPAFLSQAQVASAETVRDRLNAAELDTLTNARVAIVKFGLQLTPEQEKKWVAVEESIRARADGRQARAASIQARVDGARDKNVVEAVQDRDPIMFLNRRADALTQRAAELKRLAAAWQPLFETLSADQRRRLGVVAVFAFREMRDEAEDRLLENGDKEDELLAAAANN
jgi:LTXXQ motif family protein